MDASEHLRHAARLAMRGHGGAEPNPMVGCVIIGADGSFVGWGFHRNVGGPHAEREALQRAGEKARGGTAYVTLEPCNRTGRTPPCTKGLIEAGIQRVVFAVRDPHPAATGSENTLRAAGVDVTHEHNASAAIVTSPFLSRIRTGLPFVIAKWAQSSNGKLATPAGSGRWISSERSRRMVHRERGRVDAILTGIGTVLADDPLLTVRTARKRRTPRRVVIDTNLKLPSDCAIVKSIDAAPVTVLCGEHVNVERIELLRALGVDVIALALRENRLPLYDALHTLARHRDVATVMTECGPGLLQSLFAQRLINMMWVFIAPMQLHDETLPAMDEPSPTRLALAQGMTLLDERNRGPDVMQLYGRTSAIP